MPEQDEAFEMKDVFISHSWGDKLAFAEPLVSALEGAGIRCWYDLLEIKPGDSLLERINHGLTHSKVIVFCLSDNFLRGKWSVKELNSMVGLSAIDESTVRIIPLMLTEPEKIQATYPIPFADMMYIRWHEAELDEIVNRIAKVVAEVDGTSKDYWMEEARKAYRNQDFVRASLYSRRVLDIDQFCFTGVVYYLASLLQLDRTESVCTFLSDSEDIWINMEEKLQVKELPLLDFVQDKLSTGLGSTVPDGLDVGQAVCNLLTTDLNSERNWKYLLRLFGNPSFNRFQPDMVIYAALRGREESASWLREIPASSEEKSVREAVANVLYPMATKLPDSREEVVSIAQSLLQDDSEDVRMLALITCYFFAGNGRKQTLESLEDPSPMVRLQAFQLLSGEYNMVINDEWEPEEFPPREADPLLTPGVLEGLLRDADEIVISGVLDAIVSGIVECPPDVNVMDIGENLD